LVIAVCLAAYTIFTLATLENRKTARQTHEPWAEAQARAEKVRRAETAGYKLITATTERPADPALMDEAINKFRATITPAPAGVPAEISILISPQPRLPDNIRKIAAPATISPNDPCQILYTCQLPDDRKLHAGTSVYIKDNDLVIITHFDTLDGDLRARTRETTVLLTLPGGVFTAGRTYNITLAARDESRRWTMLAN
jgi:hypothetical protein